MNQYRFDDIAVGQTAEFRVRISDADMQAFRRITGDENPLHSDPAYARTCGYGDAVCYGMLTASFVSTLAGCYLPGVKSLVQNVNLDFTAPVYVGETLTVTGTVSHKSELVKTIKLRVRIVKEDGAEAVRGSMLVGVRENG